MGSEWCAAKPSVPGAIVQQAMDYACGSGADCDSIQPSGPCFRPDTMLAHASFAFNSYWQRTKASGATCDFGVTAISSASIFQLRWLPLHIDVIPSQGKLDSYAAFSED